MATTEEVYFCLVEEFHVYDDVASRLCEQHKGLIKDEESDTTIAENILEKEAEENGGQLDEETYFYDADDDFDDEEDDDYYEDDDEDEDEDDEDDPEWEDEV